MYYKYICPLVKNTESNQLLILLQHGANPADTHTESKFSILSFHPVLTTVPFLHSVTLLSTYYVLGTLLNPAASICCVDRWTNTGCVVTRVMSITKGRKE